jgi:hypothetical protein
MVTSIIKGLWATIKNPKLVLLMWFWSLLLACVAALPARRFFRTALDFGTETTGLLTRFNWGTFADLSKYNEILPFSLLTSAMVGVGIMALIGNAFVNGGIIEVIGSPADSRTLMHRFFKGGGQFFWRYTRLGILGWMLGAVSAGVVATALSAATARLGDSEWEPAGTVQMLAVMAVSGLVGLLFVLALDYARIRVAREDGHRMVQAYFSAMGFVVRRVWGTYGIALVYLVFVVALLLAYVAHETVWSTSTWSAIWVLIAVQQVIMMARAGLRVMEVGAEWHYSLGGLPAPGRVAPAPAEPPVRVIADPIPATPTERGPARAEPVSEANQAREDGQPLA